MAKTGQISELNAEGKESRYSIHGDIHMFLFAINEESACIQTLIQRYTESDRGRPDQDKS